MKILVSFSHFITRLTCFMIRKKKECIKEYVTFAFAYI